MITIFLQKEIICIFLVWIEQLKVTIYAKEQQKKEIPFGPGVKFIM